MEPVIKELTSEIPQIGRVEWIGLRPDRNNPMKSVTTAKVTKGKGLDGDRFSEGTSANREITLIQQEHLKVVSSIMKIHIDEALLRRNIVVSGINLISLHNQSFKMGELILKCTGYCYPCSKMELALGKGGYNAMRGHGGITATVIQAGTVAVGDLVTRTE